MISVILPVYQEGKNIGRQIADLEKTLSPDHEILVVYDFEEDDTVPAVREIQRHSDRNRKLIRLLKNEFGSGVINAVKTGFKNAVGDLLVVMPADLADDPRTVNQMVERIQQGFDVVRATRYARQGKQIGGGLKKILSRTAGLLTPFLLGIPITDITNGFTMYRRTVLESLEIESTGGWEFSMELIMKAHHVGFRISEVPTIWRDRTSGTSKFRLWRWLPRYLSWYLWGMAKRL